MNWLSRKLLQSTLTKFFKNVSDKDIELSLVCQQYLKLRNLELRTDLIKSEYSPVLLSECRIGYMQLVFDPNKLLGEPVSIKISDVLVVLKLNENKKHKDQTYSDAYLQEYKKQVFSRTSTAESLKNSDVGNFALWLVDLANKKINLFISRVTVAFERNIKSKPPQPAHYFGASIEEIVIKSRTVIAQDRQTRVEEKQIELQRIGAFVGVSTIVNIVEKVSVNREVMRRSDSISRLYFLRDMHATLVAVIQQKRIDLKVDNIVAHITPYVLRETYELLTYMLPILKPNPRIRPGKGERLTDHPKARQGSALWWKYIGNLLKQRIDRHRQYNIVSNPFFRRYVFCIIYSLVAEPTAEMKELMMGFEQGRKKLDILNIHQFIIERVARIQSGRLNDSVEERVFMNFILKSSRDLKNKNIEKLQYVDFVSLQRTLDVKNGRDYIHRVEMQSFSQFTVTVAMDSAYIFMSEFGLIEQFQRLASQELQFRKQYDAMESDKESFGEYVEKIYLNFVELALEDLSREFEKALVPVRWTPKGFRQLPGCFGELEIRNVSVRMSTSQRLTVEVREVLLTDLSKLCFSPKVLQVRDVLIRMVEVSKQNRTFVVQRSGMQVYVDYVCVNMLKPFVEKLIFVGSISIFDPKTALLNVEQTQLTLGEILHNKLFKSKYLKAAVRTQTKISVNKFNLLLPVDYAVANEILVMQMLRAEVTIVGANIGVNTESTKMLFVNTYDWVKRDSIFKQVMYQKEHPGETPIMESVIINLGPMQFRKKDELRQKNQSIGVYSNTLLKRRHAPDVFINTLIFTIPLIVVRVSIKELFILDYLVRLWTSTGFTPQQFFKKKNISRYRPDHHVIDKEDVPLLELMTQLTQVRINAIAISIATVKMMSADNDTTSQDLFEIFVNQIHITSKGYSISNQLAVTITDMYLRNLSGHIPINRLVMLRFVEAMLRNSDYYRLKMKNEGPSLQDLVDQDVSIIDDNTPKVNLPGFTTRQINLEESNTGERLLSSLQFHETERSKLQNRLLLYNDTTNKAPFMSLIKTKKYLVETRQIENITRLNLSILCFLMDPDFFKNCVLMYECAKDFVLRRMDQFMEFVKAKGYIVSIKRPTDTQQRFVNYTPEEQMLMRQNNVIVDVAETNLNSFTLDVEQVNFMIYHKECIAYSIHIKNFALSMVQHFLFNEMKITAYKVLLVDTHPNVGEWPEMLRVGYTKQEELEMAQMKRKVEFDPSFQLSLLMYKNPILIRKNNCKTEMSIVMHNAHVTYLNKKVMELVNCIMFIVSKLLAVKKKFRGVQRKVQNKSERFLYSISIEHLKVILPQNSLSKEHFKGVIKRGWVGNSEHFLTEKTNSKEQSTNPNESVVFQQCEKEDSNYVQFQSFVEDNEEAEPKLQNKVIVQVTDLLVEPMRMGLNGIYLISAPICKIDINLAIPNITIVDVRTERPLSISLNELEFQLLMRTFTQNFVEKTMVFDNEQLNRERRMDREIDQEFRKELKGTNIIQEEDVKVNEELRVTTEVLVSVFQASINVYGTNYNLSLITHAISVVVKLFNNNSKDIDLALETVEFYNNISNRMFINSYDDEKDNAMGDFIYQPPPEQVFQASTRFTQEDKQRYIERVAKRYRFRPRHKQDLDVHNQTASTVMEGWGEEDPPEKETRTFKVKKCLNRVFCGCCFKPNKDLVDNVEVAHLIVESVNEGERLLHAAAAAAADEEVILDSREEQTQEQLNRSYITSEEDMIPRRYYGRQLGQNLRNKTTKSTFMTMMIHMCPTGEKNIQLFLNNLNMAMSEHKEIIYLANYMVKGFEQEKNSKIRKHLRYNNYPPFYLAMKLSNSKTIIGKSLDEDGKSYLQSIEDVVISQERIGDTTQGPGISKMKVEVKVVLNYCRYYNRRLEAIQLSRPINVIVTQNNVVPLQVNTMVKHSGIKEVVIFGDSSKKVQISLPLTYTKDLINIVMKLFPQNKPPEGVVDVVFEKQQTPEQILGFLLKLITDNMKVIAPGIIVELMSGKKKTLLRLEVQDGYMDIISVETPTQRYGKMRAFATVMADYFNMKTELFEPALEPFSFCVKVKGTKLNGVLHQRIRLGSISGSTEFENSLNLNLSLGLVRNLKEAWTRFNGNYQVESDSIMDLSVIEWKRQLSQEEQDTILRCYRIKRESIGAFFGKKFIKIRQIHESRSSSEHYWNLKLQQYIVIHSFFDYDLGRKIIHIRTPYRLINQTGRELRISFRKKFTAPFLWMEQLKPGICYSVPKDIYKEDIVMTPSFESYPKQQSQGYSILYLLAEYEQRSNFSEKLAGKALINRVYRLSTDNPKRFARKKDFVMECDGDIILGACIKSCRPLREKRKKQLEDESDQDNIHSEERLRAQDYDEEVHQTSVVLLPPLVIRNQLPMYLELFVDDHFYNVPACSETCITQLPKDFAHVTVAFKKFRNSAMVPIFLQTEEEQIYTLTISDTDSIGMKVSRLSELSREIILYSTHIIRNQTYEDFSIEYEGRVYNLERYFWLFITDSNIHNKKRKGKIWLYKSDIKDAQKVMNFVTNAQVVKLERPNEETAEERARKLVIDVPKRKRVTFTKEPICDNKCGNGCRKCLKGCGQCLKTMFNCKNCSRKQCKGCCIDCFQKLGCATCCGRDCCVEGSQGCFGSNGFCSKMMRRCPNICNCSECCGEPRIEMDTSIVVYEITLKRQESLVNISQTILVFYRYEIVNESDGELILFHHNVEVMRLEPKIRRQVYYYKSNSEWFRIARYDREEGKLLFSDLFRINEPRQFIVPVPKELHKQKNCVYPYETNYLYTVRTSEAEDMLFIRIVNTDITRCPVYFQNSTSYNVRIFEGIQDFTIPSGDKIPFFFTNLDFKKGNELMIEVEGVRKIVRMNEVSDMESIGLDDFRIGRRPQINKSFKRGRLGILFNEFHGDYNVVVDVLIQELRIYDQTWRVLQRVSLRHASFIDSEGNKIYIFLPDNDQLLITIKNHAESAAWKEILGDCLAVRTGRRIFLTVDSNRNSRIIKLQETSSEDIRSIRKLDIEVFVKNLSLAMISGYPAQVILWDLKNIKYERSRDIRRSLRDNILQVTYDDVVVLGRLKISNQIEGTSNPVVAAQNRRGDFPCFEFKASKRFSVENPNLPEDPSQIEVDDSFSTISHYTTLTLFLDEMEIIMDSNLVMTILELKRELQRHLKVYDARRDEPIAVDLLDINMVRQELRANEGTKEIYINYFNIEPIKITVSVNWSEDIEQEVKGYGLGFLGRLPFGIESAVIRLHSFTSYHVFEKRNVLINRVLRYYLDGAIFQVLNNAGSYDLLAPLRIINGLGQGARNIFYEPIYTLYKRKEVKATASKMLDGCIIFLLFMFKFLFKLVDVVFRFFSLFTFDSAYTHRRNNFHKHTMKNPAAGFRKGGKWFLSMVKEFFRGFVDRPRAMKQKYGEGGIALGILLALLGIIKVVVAIYDFFWAIGSGFVNYAVYEPHAMDIRSRPIRIFKDGTIEYFNYNEALAHEVMHNHNIHRLRNQIVYFAKSVPFAHTRNRYYIITNYRFIFCTDSLHKRVIKYYSIKRLILEGRVLIIELVIPERKSYFLFTVKHHHFKFKFDSERLAADITERLDKAIRANVPRSDLQEPVLGTIAAIL